MLPLPCRDVAVSPDRLDGLGGQGAALLQRIPRQIQLAKHGTSHSSPISQVSHPNIRQFATFHCPFRNFSKQSTLSLHPIDEMRISTCNERNTYFHMFSYVFRFFRRSKKVHVTFWRHSGGDQSWPSTRALGGQEESLRRPSLAAQALGFSLICRKHQTSSDFWHFDDTVITFVKFITS